MTVMTDEDRDYYASIGKSMLMLVVACERCGHSNPADTLVYDTGGNSPVTDLVRWAGRKQGWEAARDRMRVLVQELGLMEEASFILADALSPLAEMMSKSFADPTEPKGAPAVLAPAE